MKFIFRYFFFIAAIALPARMAAQADSLRTAASIERYSLRIELDIEHHSIRGEAQIQVRLPKDSLFRLIIAVAPAATIRSVRDSSDRKLDAAEEDLPSDHSVKNVAITIPDSARGRTSFPLRISYEETFDSLNWEPSFIDAKEFLLSSNNAVPWWPVLSRAAGSVSAERAPVALEAVFPSGYVAVANGKPDSIHTTGATTSEIFAYEHPMPLSSCFVLCGSVEFARQTMTANDSSVQYSLWYDREKYPGELAAAVLRQLRDSYSWFSSIAGRDSSADGLRAVVIGTDDGSAEWSSNNGLIIARCSYQFSSADSLVLFAPARNRWVRQVARLFSLPATESTFVFEAGWSEYLAAKFFLHEAGRDDEAQQRIRLDFLSGALDFYPAQTLAQVHNSKKNERNVFYSKGAYVFLMLEYVMGETAFDAVIDRLYRDYRRTPISLETFQQLCEESYGSPLDWFFKEWFAQTGFPELLLSTNASETNRGSFLVKAVISQRGDLFTAPVDLVFSGSTRSVTKRVFVQRQDQEFEFTLPFLPDQSELDPGYKLLRWVPRLRLLAHARTSVSFRVFDRDIINSEREANIILQLDPNNLTGWNNISLFSLGKSAVIKGDLSKAEEYFRRASALDAREPTQLYSILSLIRLGNVLEMEGKRDEAVELYKLGLTLAGRDPALYGIALTEAQKYLQQRFVPTDEFWYGEY
ncbi:MAG TPA: hypothetical protein VMF88_05240 [Bacteroidota bacterium]|nr:hypothetical protein [Bacteroidota bacterium]